MKRYFCTCFDHNYLIYGMTLFDSLVRCGCDFELFVLALSDACFERLKNADPRIVPVKLAELEAADPELAQCRTTRSRTEYIFTMSPCFPLFLFEKYSRIDLLACLDSDLFFFDSPECLFDELGERSVFIVEHRFTEEFRERAALNGRFNVACQIFRRNDTGVACLKQWRAQCIEWCFDKAEDGRYADQKYLDTWPGDFPGQVAVSHRIGADLAPWNMENYLISERDGIFTVNDEKLIFVHYQAFKRLGKHIFVWYNWSRSKKNAAVFKKLAHVYFSALNRTMACHEAMFYGLENFYPNRGAFFSPKLEALLKFVPGKALKQFLRLLFVVIFYNRHVFFGRSGE